MKVFLREETSPELFQQGHLFLRGIAVAADGDVGIHDLSCDELDICTGAAALNDNEYGDLRLLIGGIAHEQTVVLDTFTLLGGTGFAGNGPGTVYPFHNVFLVDVVV